MSNNMKYKVRDRFEDKANKDWFVIILFVNKDNYTIEFNDDEKTTEEANDEWLSNYYTKINEPLNVVRDDTTSEQKTIMNIEENKHHLIWGDTQSIELIEDFLSKEEYIGFLKGNILKYQLRLGKKDDVAKELKKIQDYTNELNKLL